MNGGKIKKDREKKERTGCGFNKSLVCAVFMRLAIVAVPERKWLRSVEEADGDRLNASTTVSMAR